MPNAHATPAMTSIKSGALQKGSSAWFSLKEHATITKLQTNYISLSTNWLLTNIIFIGPQSAGNLLMVSWRKELIHHCYGWETI